MSVEEAALLGILCLFHRCTLIVSGTGVVFALAKTGAVLGRVASRGVGLQGTGFTGGHIGVLLAEDSSGRVIGLGVLCALELQAQALPGGHEGWGLGHVARGKWGSVYDAARRLSIAQARISCRAWLPEHAEAK